MLTYRRARTVLHDELGIDPSPELQQQILTQDRQLGVEAVEARPGRSIRGYELRLEAGRGPTGVVYHAYHASLDRTVAMKVLHPELAHDAEFVRRFEVEAQRIADLEHPLVLDVGGALATAHRRQMVHGNLKPSNVLFDADDRAHVTDFGWGLVAVDGVDGRAPPSPLSDVSNPFVMQLPMARFPTTSPASTDRLRAR